MQIFVSQWAQIRHQSPTQPQEEDYNIWYRYHFQPGGCPRVSSLHDSDEQNVF